MHIEIVFKGTILSDKLRLNEESSRFEFFPLNKLPRLIAYQHRRVILDWEKKGD